MPSARWLTGVVYPTTEYTLHIGKQALESRLTGVMMDLSQWSLVLSGGLLMAGIAYPFYAPTQPGWKIGAWAGGGLWSLWFGFGALAYLGGMANLFGWLGLLAAIPWAFFLGFVLTFTIGRHMQMLALPAPILANIWFMT